MVALTLQTNGVFLERIPERLLGRIDIVCLSVDGPRAVTDQARGEGVYDRALAQAQRLRERGFSGRIDARMTISPGVQIYDAVTHRVSGCAFAFDAVYWQLNVLFHTEDWRRDQRFIRRWFERYYNPQITRLVDAWRDELVLRGRLWRLVPFAAPMHDILSGRRVDHLRWGAGRVMWAIATDGRIFPCPVMRRAAGYAVGTITEGRPSAWGLHCPLLPPCDTCDILGLCSGRCLSANVYRRWGEDGFAPVCESVRHLITQVERVAPAFREPIAAGSLALEQLDLGLVYEVIP
jgi:putative peptide-modifying radical SAM enzyme